MAGSDPASDPLIGQSLSHFRIDAKLGEGGMGVVYRATDERLRREVALKVLPDSVAGDPDRRRRFLREARAAAAVTHPNIASVFDIGEADGHAFIAMELVQGETLRAKMEPGLTHFDALRIAKEIAKGLAEAHASGIVHRDLKPENVMITRGGGVKILDFGLAKVVDSDPGASGTGATQSQTAEGRVMGTPPYMSPEQAEGAVDIDVRSDVFSFGAMLYEMLAGVRPFRGSTRIAVLYAVMHREPEPLAAEVQASVAAVVARCLKKKTAERFASGSELLAALEGAGGDASASALPAPRGGVASGMGTALGATLAADTAAKTSEPRAGVDATAGTKPRSGGWAPGVVAVMVVLSAALAAGAWWLPRRVSGTAGTTAPAPSGSAAVVDRGVSRSSNPEAERFFEAATRAIHDDTPEAKPLLESAVKDDPTFGGAYLRLWSLTEETPGGHRDEYYKRVLALRDTLSARDRELFACLDVPKGPAREARLDAYLALYPDEATAWVARLDSSERLAATVDHALAVDPTLAFAMGAKASRLRVAERFSEALTLTTRCLEISPRASECTWGRAVSLDHQGEDCAAAEASFRRLVELTPQFREAHMLLGGVLAARGASVDAVREALGSETTPFSSDRTPVEALVPMLEGDFPEAERIAREAAARVAASAEETDHAGPAAVLIFAYAEAGEDASAGAVAADYLSRRPAWREPLPRNVGTGVAFAVRGGRMTRADADRVRDEAFRALVEAKEDPAAPADAWALTYAQGVRTRVEALAALAKLDALGLTMPITAPGETGPGEVLFLAGRGEEARPRLERVARACSLILGGTFMWARTHLYLGELDEQRGEKAAACAQFAKILDRWGHAKPRSVTADEARAHARKLGCDLAAAR